MPAHPSVKLIKDAELAERVMSYGGLVYWTVCPLPAKDGEWYESHWHPCTSIPYEELKDLQELCDKNLLGMVIYD